MTDEEKEELERLQLELLRHDKKVVEAKKAMAKTTLIGILAIVIVFWLTIVILIGGTLLTRTVITDTDGDGFNEVKRVFVWQVDDYNN